MGRAYATTLPFEPSAASWSPSPANGTGKRTLLETVVGRRAARGRVALDDQTLDSFRRRATAFAYMPDEAALPEEASVTTNPLR